MQKEITTQFCTENVHLLGPLRSEKLGNRRGVVVWLPPSYHTSPNQRFPTLYFQDGQSVLDDDSRFVGVKAGADSWVKKLSDEGLMTEIILVAVDAVEGRDQEYSPAIRGHDYCDFVVGQIKPLIDSLYRTMPDPENTGVCGWSLGAFVSLYMAWIRPDVFGMAACMSTCFFDCPTTDDGDMVLRTYKELLHGRRFSTALRLYFDYGLSEHLDGDLSQPGPGQTEALLASLQHQDMVAGRQFEFHLEPSGQHTVEDWRKRLFRPLMFLFPVLPKTSTP